MKHPNIIYNFIIIFKSYYLSLPFFPLSQKKSSHGAHYVEESNSINKNIINQNFFILETYPKTTPNRNHDQKWRNNQYVVIISPSLPIEIQVSIRTKTPPIRVSGVSTNPSLPFISHYTINFNISCSIPSPSPTSSTFILFLNYFPR